MKEVRIHNILNLLDILNHIYFFDYGSNFVSYNLDVDKLSLKLCCQRDRNVFESFLGSFSFLKVFVVDNITLEVWFL